MDEGPRDTVELTDPRALRALAHPTRLTLVGLLRRDGPMTATRAGERIGESAASCSYHLRQLARWGLVEEAGGGHGRERPWRATARATSWKVTSPDQAEPSAALSSMVAQLYHQRILASLGALPGQPPAWQRALQLIDRELLLTPEQLEALGQALLEVLDRFPDAPETSGAAAGDAAAAVRAGDGGASRRVGVYFAAVPVVEDEA